MHSNLEKGDRSLLNVDIGSACRLQKTSIADGPHHSDRYCAFSKCLKLQPNRRSSARNVRLLNLWTQQQDTVSCKLQYLRSWRLTYLNLMASAFCHIVHIFPALSLFNANIILQHGKCSQLHFCSQPFLSQTIKNESCIQISLKECDKYIGYILKNFLTQIWFHCR